MPSIHRPRRVRRRKLEYSTIYARGAVCQIYSPFIHGPMRIAWWIEYYRARGQYTVQQYKRGEQLRLA